MAHEGFEGSLRPERTAGAARKAWSRIAALSLLLLIPFPGFAQDAGTESAVSIPVIDKSPWGSPLAISGTAWLGWRLRGDKLRSSEDAEVIGRNISSKPIVTLVALMTAGNTTYTNLRFEFFFFCQALQPGGTLNIVGKHGLWRGWTEQPILGADLSTVMETNSEFKVLFAQFADGSVFGDTKAAREWQKNRYKNWLLLRELKQLYQQRGEEEFVKALDNRVDSDVIDTIFSTIRVTQKMRGSEAALVQLDRMLTYADQRRREMGSAAFGTQEAQ